MQHLHVVGFTTDRDGLILTVRRGSKSGGYVLPIDDRLLAWVAELGRGSQGGPGPESAPLPEGAGAASRGMDLSAAGVNGEEAGPVEQEVGPRSELGPSEGPIEGRISGGSQPERSRPQSLLSPREIQARLRAGHTLEEVAQEAGVDLSWVDRFAAPILAEQARVVDRACNLVLSRPRVGPSALPLAASVRANLADRGLGLPGESFEEAWSGHSLEGSRWVVRFRYRLRSRGHVAEWEVDVAGGSLIARNRLASDLGFVDVRTRPGLAQISPSVLSGRPTTGVDPGRGTSRSSRRSASRGTSSRSEAGPAQAPTPARRAKGSLPASPVPVTPPTETPTKTPAPRRGSRPAQGRAEAARAETTEAVTPAPGPEGERVEAEPGVSPSNGAAPSQAPPASAAGLAPGRAAGAVDAPFRTDGSGTATTPGRGTISARASTGLSTTTPSRAPVRPARPLVALGRKGAGDVSSDETEGHRAGENPAQPNGTVPATVTPATPVGAANPGNVPEPSSTPDQRAQGMTAPSHPPAAAEPA